MSYANDDFHPVLPNITDTSMQGFGKDTKPDKLNNNSDKQSNTENKSNKQDFCTM